VEAVVPARKRRRVVRMLYPPVFLSEARTRVMVSYSVIDGREKVACAFGIRSPSLRYTGMRD
jgi:hypothetical protein